MEYTYEFMKRCHGLRFRATLGNKPQEGIIKVMSEGVVLCYGEEAPGYLATFGRRDTLSFSEQTFSILPSDFEIIPRNPETYKDWQVGDKIAARSINKGGEVIFRCGELVICKDKGDGRAAGPFTCEELFEDEDCRLVLTDIEKQIIEEKKVVEDIPKESEPEKHDFKKFDPVLVRDVDDGIWHIAAFVENNSGFGRPFYATGGIGRVGYYFCLPYNERTKHLLGTNNDYEEEQS